MKADYTHMVRAGLGSCGTAGGDRNLEWMLDVAKEVFAELGVQDAKVATISAELDPEIVFFAPDAHSTGIRNSRFVPAGAPGPWSIKLEGSCRLGRGADRRSAKAAALEFHLRC